MPMLVVVCTYFCMLCVLYDLTLQVLLHHLDSTLGTQKQQADGLTLLAGSIKEADRSTLDDALRQYIVLLAQQARAALYAMVCVHVCASVHICTHAEHRMRRYKLLDIACCFLCSYCPPVNNTHTRAHTHTHSHTLTYIHTHCRQLPKAEPSCSSNSRPEAAAHLLSRASWTWRTG